MLPETHRALVCGGSQLALDLLARAFVDTGDAVVLVAPSCLRALQVFQWRKRA